MLHDGSIDGSHGTTDWKMSRITVRAENKPQFCICAATVGVIGYTYYCLWMLQVLDVVLGLGNAEQQQATHLAEAGYRSVPRRTWPNPRAAGFDDLYPIAVGLRGWQRFQFAAAAPRSELPACRARKEHVLR